VAQQWRPWEDLTVAESNTDRARRGFEAALRGDLDALAELLDPQVRWHGGDPTASGSCRNRAEALAFLSRSQLLHAGDTALVDAVGIADKVVLILRRPPRGHRAGSEVANLATFRDGKVIEMVHYPDPADALAAART
jgi:ketosteroid isomerase-like protein